MRRSICEYVCVCLSVMCVVANNMYLSLNRMRRYNYEIAARKLIINKYVRGCWHFMMTVVVCVSAHSECGVVRLVNRSNMPWERKKTSAGSL